MNTAGYHDRYTDHYTERRAERGANRGLALLGGLGLGVALMYFLDPGRGARRRALVRDKTGSALRSGQWKFQRRAEDLRNRAAGVAAEARGRMRAETVSDEQLVARVRAQLGHHMDHPGALEVAARDGIVTLRGQVLRSELDAVLGTARGVRGVEQVRNELDVRDTPAHSPSLQG